MENIKHRLRDIPITATLGELCLNVKKAFKIMELINQGEYNDAFNIAREVLNDNDTIISSQVDKDAMLKLLKKGSIFH